MVNTAADTVSSASEAEARAKVIVLAHPHPLKYPGLFRHANPGGVSTTIQICTCSMILSSFKGIRRSTERLCLRSETQRQSPSLLRTINYHWMAHHSLILVKLSLGSSYRRQRMPDPQSSSWPRQLTSRLWNYHLPWKKCHWPRSSLNRRLEWTPRVLGAKQCCRTLKLDSKVNRSTLVSALIWTKMFRTPVSKPTKDNEPLVPYISSSRNVAESSFRV